RAGAPCGPGDLRERRDDGPAGRDIDVGQLVGDEEQQDGEQVEQQLHGCSIKCRIRIRRSRSTMMAERTRNRRNTLERRCLPKSLKRLYKGSSRPVFRMLEEGKKAWGPRGPGGRVGARAGVRPAARNAGTRS